MSKRLTTKEFIQKANKIHNSFYVYTNTLYKISQVPIIITCPIHGDFEQTPNIHLSGSGCKKCANYNKGWIVNKWKQAANNSIEFDSFKVYIIKCWNETEKFYKIGKTYKTVVNRFKSKEKMPYNYEVLQVWKGEAEFASNLEKQLQKENKEFKYIPKIKFNGYKECFTQILS